MKFLIEQVALLAVATRACHVIDRKASVAALRHACFDATGECLSVSATNFDQTLELEQAIVPVEPGQALVEAHTLKAIAAKLPKGSQVELALAGDQLAISAGRARFELPVLPVSDYPQRKPDDIQTHPIDRGVLSRLLSSVRFAISNEETRYYLNGIYLERGLDDEGAPCLTAVATDGHRLAKCQRVLADSEGEGAAELIAAGWQADGAGSGIILPKGAVAVILDAFVGAGELAIGWDAERLRLEAPGQSLVTNLIAGSFPDYQRIIPDGKDEGSGARLMGAVSDFAEALARVSLVASTDSRAVALEPDGEAAVSLTSGQAGSGQASECLEFEVDGALERVGFNGRYLADALERCGSGEVCLTLRDGQSPALMQVVDQSDWLAVIMPMRV